MKTRKLYSRTVESNPLMQKFLFLRQNCAFWAPGAARVASKRVKLHEIYMAQPCEVYGDVFDDPGGHLSVLAIFSQ